MPRDIASAAESPWWRDGLRFSCLGCGVCCRGEPGAVWFTDAERLGMANALGISPEEFSFRYVWKKYGRPSLRERTNYDCIFLDRNPDRCAIYAARPSQCKTFPFWPEVLKSKLAWDKYSLSCPGMNQGRLYEYGEILAIMA